MIATRHTHRPGRRGFTLVELAVVVLIIGMLLAFILAVSYGSVEQGRVRGTQALITKLEVGINERMKAIVSQGVDATSAQQWLACDLDLVNGVRVAAPARAELIARFDHVRAELPDVFFLQNDPLYPINFGGLPFLGDPLGTPGSLPSPYHAYALPQGVATMYVLNSVPQWVGVIGPGTGILGASYNARASLHKSIGLDPTGTDAADNDGDLLIDELDECTATPEGLAAFSRFSGNHQHHTARAELLYALLVNGTGPLGSIFEASEFRTGVEVADTDNDGALEFIDAWGSPLQFFRWPIYYQSPSVQKGSGVYGAYETRSRFPLDPASRLMAPAWWSNYASGPPYLIGELPQNYFEPFFTSLTDPNWVSGSTPQPTAWDISGLYPRREFGCKFLILSAGPDKELGVPLLTDSQVATTAATNPDLVSYWLNGFPNPSQSMLHANGTSSQYGIIGESYAQLRNGYPLTNLPLIQANLDPAATLTDVGPAEAADDISNHELLSQGGGLR